MVDLESIAVTYSQLGTGSCNDTIWRKVRHYIAYGWPSKVLGELKPFHNKSSQLTIGHQIPQFCKFPLALLEVGTFQTLRDLYSTLLSLPI